ncbi:MAG: family 10 glycosylhydrolase [Bythopirellula sp.]|nr:family 10 glycosylhydrolase [Bythopirellula sp.]
MLKVLTVLVGLLIALKSNVALAETPPVRGVWVANVATTTLNSPQDIHEFVASAEQIGVNTLYVVVWNRGMTTYPSEIMQREFGLRCDPRYAKFDVLQEFVTAAHAKNIRVIAWFEFGFASSYQQADGGHILRKHPEWSARDVDGKVASKNGFQWMNAFRPEVQDFVLSLLKEILQNYEVDGVQGDDRLPACPSLAGYDPWTVKLYQDQHDGNSPPENHFDAEWVDWRAGLLNQFMQRMYHELKSVKPDAVISSAPSIYPWSKQQYLQDWPTWLKNGWVDEVCPQIYREDLGSYRAELKKIVNEQVAAADLSLVFPGILVQTASGLHNDQANLLEMVRANRTAGVHGEVIFYDRTLREHPDWIKKAWAVE